VNKYRNYIAGLAGLALVSIAHAAPDAEITTLLTDADAVWTTVKGVIIGVVAFMVLLAFAKRVVKR